MIREQLAKQYSDEQLLCVDGLDEAIIGTCKWWNQPRRVVYSIDKCIDIFVKRDGMTPDEAREFFDFNVAGAYMGELTPMFVEDERCNQLHPSPKPRSKKKKKRS